MAATPPPKSRRFGVYKSALQAISTRTGTALPSLMVSFAILHELTALVPLVGIFFGSRALGVGERFVPWIQDDSAGHAPRWTKQKCRQWIEEGDAWAGRVGRRYGIWGFEKGQEPSKDAGQISEKIVGDVANAVVAYGMTKALLPVRVGLSFYLSPTFSRRIVDPFSRGLRRAFGRSSPPT